ncbi:hypothetical protein [Gloeobacter violaceus]|uniref:Gll1315 protein n=1 Tax=Gloeobacter violaceus (strain ATCC 29082 / PCC 7421) TaxID=251221 RepID=Q7NL11_GLOVI|nr:hypothetical protein [Gloeobacter violaceus]BAC89256.1 gll1315 [Gloeobacter violaceus PCC 7421]
MLPENWLRQLEQTAPAVALRQGVWLYPAVEIVHIAAFVLAVGAVALFDLRLVGLARALPVAPLARFLLPVAHSSFAAAALSGLMLFAADAAALAANPAFRVKLTLIALAGANAALLHAGPLRTVEQWTKVPPAARSMAVLSLLLWGAVLVCGRLIAYL